MADERRQLKFPALIILVLCVINAAESLPGIKNLQLTSAPVRTTMTILKHGPCDITTAHTRHSESLGYFDRNKPIRVADNSRGYPEWHESVTIANCSRRSLTFVPKLPSIINILLLDHNNIRSMNSSSFNMLINLVAIDISDNPLRHLASDVFNGLHKLESILVRNVQLQEQRELDLGNFLSGMSSLGQFSLTLADMPIVVFCDRNNTPFRNAQMLAKVSDVEIDASILAGLDTNSTILTESFTKSLSIIDESHVCLLQHYQAFYFKPFTSVEYLEIRSFISYTRFESDSLVSLSNMKELHIYDDSSICNDPDVNISSNFQIFILNVTSSLSRLRHIETLVISGKNNFCSRYKLQNLLFSPAIASSTSLRTVHLSSLGMQLPERAKITNIPSSVKTLDLSGNCIGVHNILLLIDSYPNITTIGARNAPSCHEFGKIGNILRLRNTQTPKNYSSKLEELYVSNCVRGCSDFFFERKCPPHIKRLELSRFPDIENLTEIGDYLNGCFEVEFLDFTGSKISNIGIGVFKDLQMLKTLQLSQNLLGRMEHGMNFLQNLKQLETLNLSSNHISSLSVNAFQNTKYLRVLDLSVNSLSEFQPTVLQMKYLVLLNLSYNHIKALSAKALSDLDSIALKSSVVLDISGNPLLCVCQTSSFFTWMLTTAVTIHNLSKLTCLLKNGTEVGLGDLENIVTHLKSSCTSKTGMYIAISVIAALTISVLSSLLVYKNRWKLRYLYYMTKLKLSEHPPEYERIFEYDAFISYAAEDSKVARTDCIKYLEEEAGLRLCIHERDFEVGNTIAYNISYGIHSSKRTVAFISKAYVNSGWCKYELNIARMESLYTHRSVLLLVILESSVLEQVPVDILDLIRTMTYLEYPEHGKQGDVKVFWRRLTEFVARK